MTDAELAQWVLECETHVSTDRPLEEAFLRLYELYQIQRFVSDEYVLCSRCGAIVNDVGGTLTQQSDSNSQTTRFFAEVTRE